MYVSLCISRGVASHEGPWPLALDAPCGVLAVYAGSGPHIALVEHILAEVSSPPSKRNDFLAMSAIGVNMP